MVTLFTMLSIILENKYSYENLLSLKKHIHLSQLKGCSTQRAEIIP